MPCVNTRAHHLQIRASIPLRVISLLMLDLAAADSLSIRPPPCTNCLFQTDLFSLYHIGQSPSNDPARPPDAESDPRRQSCVIPAQAFAVAVWEPSRNQDARLRQNGLSSRAAQRH